MGQHTFRWRTLRTTANVSLLGFLVIGFSFLLGWLFFARGQEFLGQEQRLRLQSMATIAAAALSTDDIDQIHVANDYKKPAYARLVKELIEMRTQNPDIKFAYIFRPTTDPTNFEFVADADSLDPYAVVDLNKDGIIDESDELAPPGTPYDVSETPELVEALTTATTTAEPFSDQWGTYMSGFAPIKDEAGQTIAVVGFDIDIGRYITLSQRIFSPALFALVLLVGSILAAFIVFVMWKRRLDASRSLTHERAKLLMLTFHQLGTPLTLLRWATGNLEELKKSLVTADSRDAFNKNLISLKEATDRFDGILKLLKKANQIETGNLEYKSEQADLVNTITDGIVQLQFILQERRQTVVVTAPDSLVCQFDPEQISVVLVELITNASHFSPPKSTIVVSATRDSNFVHVTVQDKGPGLLHSDLEHLFEEFSRGEKAVEQHPDGYGLGLFISHGIIDNAGGKIWADSKAGQGTTIHFTLPQN